MANYIWSKKARRAKAKAKAALKGKSKSNEKTRPARDKRRNKRALEAADGYGGTADPRKARRNRPPADWEDDGVGAIPKPRSFIGPQEGVRVEEDEYDLLGGIDDGEEDQDRPHAHAEPPADAGNPEQGDRPAHHLNATPAEAEADIRPSSRKRDVRIWHFSDMLTAPTDVRYWG